MAVWLNNKWRRIYGFTHIFLHTQFQFMYNFAYFHSEKGGHASIRRRASIRINTVYIYIYCILYLVYITNVLYYKALLCIINSQIYTVKLARPLEMCTHHNFVLIQYIGFKISLRSQPMTASYLSEKFYLILMSHKIPQMSSMIHFYKNITDTNATGDNG